MTPSEIRAAIQAVTGDEAKTDAIMKIVGAKELVWRADPESCSEFQLYQADIETFPTSMDWSESTYGYGRDRNGIAWHRLPVWPYATFDDSTEAEAIAACEAHHMERHFAGMRGE